MQKNTWLRFGAVALGAAVLAFAFTPVTEAGAKTIICHNNVDFEDDPTDPTRSVVIEVSDSSLQKHRDKHGDMTAAELGGRNLGDHFSDFDCGTLI